MDQVIALQSLTAEDEKMIKYCKFYTAMIMNEILKETPISKDSLRSYHLV